MVGPLTISVGLGLATLTGTHVHHDSDAMLATILQLKIQLSYYRDRVTLWLQGLNKHSHGSIRDLRRLLFSLPYFSFHTSMSILQHFPLVHESVPGIIIPSVYLYMFCHGSSVHSNMQMKET